MLRVETMVSDYDLYIWFNFISLRTTALCCIYLYKCIYNVLSLPKKKPPEMVKSEYFQINLIKSWKNYETLR